MIIDYGLAVRIIFTIIMSAFLVMTYRKIKYIGIFLLAAQQIFNLVLRFLIIFFNLSTNNILYEGMLTLSGALGLVAAFYLYKAVIDSNEEERNVVK